MGHYLHEPLDDFGDVVETVMMIVLKPINREFMRIDGKITRGGETRASSLGENGGRECDKGINHSPNIEFKHPYKPGNGQQSQTTIRVSQRQMDMVNTD